MCVSPYGILPAMHVFHFCIFAFSMQTYYFTKAWFPAKLQDFLLFSGYLGSKRNGHSRRFRIMFVWLKDAKANDRSSCGDNHMISQAYQDQQKLRQIPPLFWRIHGLMINVSIYVDIVWRWTNEWQSQRLQLRKHEKIKERRKMDRKNKESMKEQRKNDR